MAREFRQPNEYRGLLRLSALFFVVVIVASGFAAAFGSAASASTIVPTAATWCTAQGSSVDGWLKSTPSLPMCGPGPAYGGTWRSVDIPGPYGALGDYFNATDGFQCVELAERFLSVVDGLAPVHANGATVAMTYHAAYPETSLVVNGSSAAVGHAPEPGDVISLSNYSGFAGTYGHVAIVVDSEVDGAGNGTVTIAQENVSSSDYIYTLDLSSWRLIDPSEPGDALFQYPYAEWLSVPPVRAPSVSANIIELADPANSPLIVLSPRILVLSQSAPPDRTTGASSFARRKNTDVDRNRHRRAGPLIHRSRISPRAGA